MDNGSVLRGGVGTGKSRTALAYFYTRVCQGELEVNGLGTWEPPLEPRDIYVITTAKKRDDLSWEAEALNFRISKHAELSAGGIRLVVDSWNNITNYVAVENAFFVFDEQRLVGAGAWVKAFLKIAQANQWIMLSATPGDNWMDYIPIFLAHGLYKNRTEFIRRHVKFKPYSNFPAIDYYLETKTLEKHRDNILVEMPYERHTVRHVEQYIVDYDQELFERVWVDRWHVYEDRPLRDVGEMFLVARKVVNSDPSRIGAVLKLLEKHPRLIVFYNYNYELDALRTLASTINITMSEWNGHKHQAVPETDKWLYLVQYTAGAEAWECITTNAIVFYSLNYSYKVNEQARGRTDRMNTPYTDLWYYILRSASKIDTAIVKSIAVKKDFNEREFVKW